MQLELKRLEYLKDKERELKQYGDKLESLRLTTQDTRIVEADDASARSSTSAPSLKKKATDHYMKKRESGRTTDEKLASDIMLKEPITPVAVREPVTPIKTIDFIQDTIAYAQNPFGYEAQAQVQKARPSISPVRKSSTQASQPSPLVKRKGPGVYMPVNKPASAVNKPVISKSPIGQQKVLPPKVEVKLDEKQQEVYATRKSINFIA